MIYFRFVLTVFHPMFLSDGVTLCGWSAKQTIPLSALARNQTKGLESRSPTRPKMGEERQVRPKPGQWARGRQRRQLEKGTQKGQLAKRNGEEQSTAEETSRREIESRGSEEGRLDEFAVLSRQRSAVRKTVKDELAFLVDGRSCRQKE